MSALMNLPECQQHGPMELDALPGTKEQSFCGVWYRCTRCMCSTLFASPGLIAQLSSQSRLLVKATKP